MTKPGPHREIYRSKDGKMSISTNIPGHRWPTRDEKIDALLETGLIDQAEADRLRSIAQPEQPDG
jgi:hypothetical protein